MTCLIKATNLLDAACQAFHRIDVVTGCCAEVDLCVVSIRVACETALHCVISFYVFLSCLTVLFYVILLRVKAAMLSVRLSHRNSVRSSVRHTGGSGKNGPS